MPDVKDTRFVIDSLRRCCHVGSYAGTDPGDTCHCCAYYGKCQDLELDAAELILLLDELTDHQFAINRDAITDLRHCDGCNSEYYYVCRVHNMYGDSGCNKIQSDAADILEKMYLRYIFGNALGRQNGKTYSYSIAYNATDGEIYSIKPIHKEDMIDAMAYSNYLSDAMGSWFERYQKQAFREHFEYPLTPKSIEQSADHKTVVVLWQDNTKTIVKLSPNDKDDIDTAFAYALAKKIFGTNTHLKKVVRTKLNEHKPKVKGLPSDPNPKELPVDFKYIKAAKELFLESHVNYDVQIGIEAVNGKETRVHMYNSHEGIIEYMKNVESTLEALSKLESMWQRFNTEEVTPYGTVQHYSDGDYSIISSQTQSGLFDRFNKETEDEPAE